MKRETLRHPKTLDLASRLNCSRPQALGYLMLLWDFTADYAIQGDIGRLPDGAIAQACDWPGPPADFTKALMDARWLDRDSRHRLLIHDWQDHCERWVKAKMEKLGLTFYERTAERSTEASNPPTEQASTEASSPRDQTEPIQSKPNRTKSAPEVPPEIPPALASSDEFLKAWTAWLKYRRGRRISCRTETLEGQLKRLAELGPQAAAKAIDDSITNGWQSVAYPGEKRGKERTLTGGHQHDPALGSDPRRKF